MTIKGWLICAGAALLVVAGVFTWGRITHKADTVAMAQADQAHTAALAAASQGVAHDQAVEAQKPVLTADALTVAQLRGEVQRLRAGSGNLGPMAPASTPDDPQSVPPTVDLAPLVAEQDKLIGALTKENGDLKVQVLNLTAARDSWHSAYDESSKEAGALRIAHSAALAAAQSNRWMGRLEGFAVGFGSGYLAGKLTH